MKTVQKLKFLIGMYVTFLVFLLLSVMAMPLLVQHGFAITRRFVIAEETLESILIVILFGASFLILKAFKHTLKSYQRAVLQAGREKSRLVSRLAEAFSYIGEVNVEIKEIQDILCGPGHYPQTKNEFKELFHWLAAKAMAVTGAPWIVVRMINRCSGRTIKEYTSEQHKGVLPSATIGNRVILEGRLVEGLKTIVTRQKNLDIVTVCILPSIPLTEEEIVLLTAIASRIEMLFLLYRAGFPHQPTLNPYTEKETYHDTHY
jgi:hypothetical protein